MARDARAFSLTGELCRLSWWSAIPARSRVVTSKAGIKKAPPCGGLWVVVPDGSAVHDGVEGVRVKPLVPVTGDHDLDSVVATEGVDVVEGFACFLEEIEGSATMGQGCEDLLAGGVGDCGRHEFGVCLSDAFIVGHRLAVCN